MRRDIGNGLNMGSEHNSKISIKSLFMGKNEIIKEKQRKYIENKRKSFIYRRRTICKRPHMKLIYVPELALMKGEC